MSRGVGDLRVAARRAIDERREFADRAGPAGARPRAGRGHGLPLETDQVDEFLQTGWSVLAVGVLNVMSEESLRMLAPGQTPEPSHSVLRFRQS